MAELLEHLTGKGTVFNRQVEIAKVQYDVRTYQEYIDTTSTAGPSRIPGLRFSELTLVSSNPIEMTRDRLTLIMADGRKLDFIFHVVNWCEATGKGTGPIYS